MLLSPSGKQIPPLISFFRNVIPKFALLRLYRSFTSPLRRGASPVRPPALTAFSAAASQKAGVPPPPAPTTPDIMIKKEITFDRFVRGLIAILLIVACIYLLRYLSKVLIPFFVAWMVAYLVYPIVRFLQSKCRVRSRLVAITLTLILVAGTFTGFGYIIIPPMLDEVAHVKDVALDYIERGASNPSIPPEVQRFFNEHVDRLKLESLLREKDFVEAVKNTLPKVWNVFWSTAAIVVNFVASLIGLLYLLFILTDYERYAKGWIGFVPPRRRPFARRLMADVERYMAGYFRGQALIALSNCVMFSIGFALIGFPMPVGLGCLIGVISFVPYLQIVGFVPAALLALLTTFETGQNFWLLMGMVALVYLVVQILQDTIFTPRIMGKIMGLPPAVILLSLSVFGYALGIIGLIIALPVTTLAMAYYKRYVVGAPLEPLPLATPGADADGFAADDVTAGASVLGHDAPAPDPSAASSATPAGRQGAEASAAPNEAKPGNI